MTSMISRTSRVWTAPEPKSCPYKIEIEIVKQIEPISFMEDKKTVKEYIEKEIIVEKKTKWKDYIKSFDVGSPADQVMEHLTKGTPLITGHTLPPGDYTESNLAKSAEVLHLMRSKGITLDMLEKALSDSSSKVVNKEVVEKEGDK